MEAGTRFSFALNAIASERPPTAPRRLQTDGWQAPIGGGQHRIVQTLRSNVPEAQESLSGR
jgi:hypothetical protein